MLATKKNFLSACRLTIFVAYQRSDLVISAQRNDGPESFIIEIENSKVDGLLSEFAGDMSFLAQFLRLQDKRMVLINPVSHIKALSETSLTQLSFI